MKRMRSLAVICAILVAFSICVTPALADPIPSLEAATTEVAPEPIGDDESLVASPESTTESESVIVPMWVTYTYHRSSVVAYAAEWYDGYNADYPCFTGYGGDCTNFASQCVHAGGVPMDYIEPWYCEHTGSGTDLSDYTFTSAWCQAPALYRYLLINTDGIKGTRVYSTSSLALGDLIFYDFTNDGTIDHASVVVGFDGGVPLIAAHSASKYGEPYTVYTAAVHYFVHLPDTWTQIEDQGR